MDIKRDKYLNDLINRMHNGMIKVVTGIRRCGKSYLLFNIFKNYLLKLPTPLGVMNLEKINILTHKKGTNRLLVV